MSLLKLYVIAISFQGAFQSAIFATDEQSTEVELSKTIGASTSEDASSAAVSLNIQEDELDDEDMSDADASAAEEENVQHQETAPTPNKTTRDRHCCILSEKNKLACWFLWNAIYLSSNVASIGVESKTAFPFNSTMDNPGGDTNTVVWGAALYLSVGNFVFSGVKFHEFCKKTCTNSEIRLTSKGQAYFRQATFGMIAICSMMWLMMSELDALSGKNAPYHNLELQYNMIQWYKLPLFMHAIGVGLFCCSFLPNIFSQCD